MKPARRQFLSEAGGSCAKARTLFKRIRMRHPKSGELLTTSRDSIDCKRNRVGRQPHTVDASPQACISCQCTECARIRKVLAQGAVVATSPKKKGTRKPASNSKHRWVSKVKTVSTYPSEGLFTKDPETIARQLASKRVSPKGPGSGMRMLTYFINRAGKGLSPARRKTLEKAKELLAERVREAREKRRKRAA